MPRAAKRKVIKGCYMKKDKYIVYFVSRTMQRMNEFISTKLVEHELEELIPSHGNILTALYESEGELSMQEISKRVGKDKSTVTHLTNKLIAMGYLKKEQGEKDRRISYVKLTEQGHAIKERYDLISEEVYKTAYTGFSKAEKKMFLSLLKRVNDNFRQ